MMYSKDFEEFKPIDFLELSKELYENLEELGSKPSAIKRTIVSRLYYASFLHVRAWFVSYGNYSSNGPLDHYNIPKMIIGNTPMMGIFEKELRDKLIILGKNRRVCDYEFEIPMTYGNKNKYYKYSLEDLIDYSYEIISTFNKFNET